MTNLDIPAVNKSKFVTFKCYKRGMRMNEVRRRLIPITSSQWGMVTTAQAKHAGVNRMTLTRLVQHELFSRMMQGVYRDEAVPTNRFDYIHAAWLALQPEQTAEVRLTNNQFDAVVCLETAAWLYGFGDFVPEPYHFAVTWRQRTKHPDTVIHRKSYALGNVDIREGIPVTSVKQTFADLLGAGVDRSLIADALRSALGQRLISPREARNLLTGHSSLQGMLNAFETPDADHSTLPDRTQDTSR